MADFIKTKHHSFPDSFARLKRSRMISSGSRERLSRDAVRGFAFTFYLIKLASAKKLERAGYREVSKGNFVKTCCAPSTLRNFTLRVHSRQWSLVEFDPVTSEFGERL